VHTVECQAELSNHLCSGDLIKVLCSHDFVIQISSCDVFHNDVIVSRIFEELEDASDMRMVCFFKNLEFLSHKVSVLFVLVELFLGYNFNSTGDIRLSVAALFHCSERATSEGALYFIVL
jgi:hypothetical protein